MALPERRSTRALQIAIGVAVSAALVWWAFHGTNFTAIWSSVRQVHVITLALAIGVATVPFALRVPRWRYLLRADDGTALPVKPLWQAIAIGFAANNVLPLRAGELLRVAAASRLTRVSFAAALSSVAVERVIDALTLVALLGGGLLAAHLPSGLRINGGTPIATLAARTGIICLAALVAAVLAAWRRPAALALLERLLPSGPLSARFVHFVDHVLAGLGAMRDLRRAVPVLAWSLIIWVTNAAAFYIALRAFDLPVPFSGALILQGALMVGIAVPSTPGYAGAFEWPIIGVLFLYGIDKEHALAYAITYHITTFIPITFLGALAAVRTGTHLRAPSAAP